MASNSLSITELANLISGSVSSLNTICTENNLRVPLLNETFTTESEAFRSNKDAAKMANIIAAAAFQLAATLLPPQEAISQAASGYIKSIALRTAIECHVPEILRQAGPEGLHSKVIAKTSGVDDAKLARLLRYLANRHIFREVTPDVFANNRISGLLDTGKPVDDLIRDPESKYDETSGFTAYMEHLLTDCYKGSPYLVENLKDPITGHSSAPNHAPFQRGMKTDMPYWDWVVLPEQSYNRRRFGIAMKGTAAIETPNLIADVFDWKSLPNSSVIVDVGGGIGTSVMTVLKAHPHLHARVQDVPLVITDGTKFWQREFPQALTSGQVQLQAHDFFTPQPIHDASVFLMKHILHDWPDSQSIQILTHLRTAATPDTRLLILESIIPYTCPDPNAMEDEFEATDSIPGLHLGAAKETAYTTDIVMLIGLNSQERTLGQFRKVFESSGWRIVRIKRDEHGVTDCIECVPA